MVVKSVRKEMVDFTAPVVVDKLSSSVTNSLTKHFIDHALKVGSVTRMICAGLRASCFFVWRAYRCITVVCAQCFASSVLLTSCEIVDDDAPSFYEMYRKMYRKRYTS